MADNERMEPIARALTEAELRLNCLMVAASARTYSHNRMADPITIAAEFFTWVTTGEKPKPSQPMFGGKPAPVTPGFGATEPPTEESERARRYAPSGGDLIDVRE